MTTYKFRSSLFIIIIFLVIALFTCFITAAIEESVDSQRKSNNLLSSKSISFSISQQQNIKNNVKDLFNLQGNYLIYREGLDVNNNGYGIIFKGNLKTRPIIKEGRFFTEDDFSDKNKFIVIGEKLVPDTEQIGGKRYFTYENEYYQVIGIMKDDNFYGKLFFINLNAVIAKNNFFIQGKFDIDAENNTIDLFNNLKKKLQDKNFVVTRQNTDKLISPLYKALSDKKIEIIMMIVGILTFVLDTVSVTIYWIDSRRQEIGIRKCMGGSNMKIATELLGELISLILISFFIGYILYILISFIVNKKIVFYFMSFLISLGIVLIAAIITSIVPIVKASKIEPAEMMR